MVASDSYIEPAKKRWPYDSAMARQGCFVPHTVGVSPRGFTASCWSNVSWSHSRANPMGEDSNCSEVGFPVVSSCESGLYRPNHKARLQGLESTPAQAARPCAENQVNSAMPGAMCASIRVDQMRLANSRNAVQTDHSSCPPTPAAGVPNATVDQTPAGYRRSVARVFGAV